MPTTEALVFVFIAALLTDLATGLGAVPFFFVRVVSTRGYVILWGFASGIMLSTSIFGLLPEGAAQGSLVAVAGGVIAGTLLVHITSQIINVYEFHPRKISAGYYSSLERSPSIAFRRVSRSVSRSLS